MTEAQASSVERELGLFETPGLPIWPTQTGAGPQERACWTPRGVYRFPTCTPNGSVIEPVPSGPCSTGRARTHPACNSAKGGKELINGLLRCLMEESLNLPYGDRTGVLHWKRLLLLVHVLYVVPNRASSLEQSCLSPPHSQVFGTQFD